MLDVHVVSHTHWDREWYLPVERFRQRLVALIDELIDDPPMAGESFLLDGQAIVLDDYLAVRPDRTEVLGDLLRAKRLEAGPWYVLADELIPSGEALVRNLLAGVRVLRRLGATAPPVLYCPDSFGHPAALPSIAAGFGLGVVLVWRGYGSRRFPPGDTARWRAPSGETALLYHLPRSGYELASNLPVESDRADARWAEMREQLAPRSTTGVMLLPHGADHHARQLGHRDAIVAIEAAGVRDAVHRSSLRAFETALTTRAAGTVLPVVEGELRDSYGYTWTLQGTFATRAHEKRLNALAERALVREAEPWSAMVAREGRSRRELLAAAWRTLLEAHPHDTLCGCSIDDVAAAMELRVHSARHQASGLRDDAICELIRHDPTVARTAKDRWHSIALVRNPVARRRSSVAIVEVEEFVADVPVGPGSSPVSVGAPQLRRKPPIVGTLGPLQVLDKRTGYSRVESPRHYPDNDLVTTTRVAAWVADAPPYGIIARQVGRRSHGAPRPDDHVSTTPRSLRNSTLEVSVEPDGTITLVELATGRRLSPLIRFEDDADGGDLYTPSPRPRPFQVRVRDTHRVHRGPLRGELAVRLRVADAGAPRGDGHVDMRVGLILDAGAPFLRVEVRGDNRRSDHRLRIVFAADTMSPDVWADAAFGPVQRVPMTPAPDETLSEHAPRTAPLHRYVSVFGEGRGVTIVSDGLAEYESFDGGLAITLVRSVGELSRNDLPERPGHAGWPVSTPSAQCLGPFAANFGVLLHGARSADTIDLIERCGEDVLLPMAGTTLRSALRVPPDVTGPELVGVGLGLSAMKESEDGASLLLRCVNLLDESVSGAWRLPFAISDASLARLDETPIAPADFDGSAVMFVAGPRAIVTILVR